MNTKQIAEEARNEIRRYFNKPYYPNEYENDKVLLIIQAAIEKAYDEGYDRGFDKGYLADESRAAHASGVEEQAWHDGTMSPEIRATINRSKNEKNS